MLSSPTPFPHVGSYALIDLDGGRHLARIIQRDQFETALISLPLVEGSAGNCSVALRDLVDGTPLTRAEADELDGLCVRGLGAYDRGLHPLRNLSAQQRERFESLAARAAAALGRERLLDDLARRERAQRQRRAA